MEPHTGLNLEQHRQVGFAEDLKPRAPRGSQAAIAEAGALQRLGVLLQDKAGSGGA